MCILCVLVFMNVNVIGQMMEQPLHLTFLISFMWTFCVSVWLKLVKFADKSKL